MQRILTAYLILGICCFGQAAPPAKPVGSATLTGIVREQLAAEWKDPAGAIYCLRALDLYTRAGSSSPSESNAEALRQLREGISRGAPESVSTYYGLVKGGLRDLLAAAHPGSLDTSKEKIDSYFSLAGKAVSAVFASNPQALAAVNRTYQNKDYARALYELLGTAAQAVSDNAAAQAKNADAHAAVLKEEMQLEQAIALAQAATPKASGELPVVSAPVANPNSVKPEDCKGDAQTYNACEAYLTKAQAHLEALQKEKQPDAKKDNDALRRARTDLNHARAQFLKSSNAYNAANLKAIMAQSSAEYSGYQEAVDAVWVERRALLQKIQEAAQPRKDASAAFDKAITAVDLMETYRICYSLDPVRLFTLVNQLFQ